MITAEEWINQQFSKQFISEDIFNHSIKLLISYENTRSTGSNATYR